MGQVRRRAEEVQIFLTTFVALDQIASPTLCEFDGAGAPFPVVAILLSKFEQK